MEWKRQELAKPKWIFTISQQRSSSSCWTCVTFVSYTVARSLFPVKSWSLGLTSNITSTGSTTLRKVSEYGHRGHVHPDTVERKIKAPLWKPMKARNLFLKSIRQQMIQLTISAKTTVESNRNNLINAFCIRVFAVQNDYVARGYRFSVLLTNPDNI